jgi:hypothetical protein
VLKELLDEVFEDIGISSALEYSTQDQSILSIRREYLIASVPVKFGNLNWCHT